MKGEKAKGRRDRQIRSQKDKARVRNDMLFTKGDGAQSGTLSSLIHVSICGSLRIPLACLFVCLGVLLELVQCEGKGGEGKETNAGQGSSQ